MSTKIQPDILRYQDYSLFLDDFVKNKKKSDINWSLGSWAKTLGLKSTSSITKVLNKNRAPGKKITNSLINYFNFNNKESIYFQDLINLAKAKNDPSLQSILLKRLTRNSQAGDVQLIEAKTFEIIRSWFHLAIREMSRLKNFKLSPLWISQNLRFSVSETQAQTAIDNLLKTKLLKINKKKVKISPGNLSTSEDIHNLAIQDYHNSMLDNAKKSLKQVKLDEREVLSGTLSFNLHNMNKAKELLRNFLDEFGAAMDSDGGDEIYQIQMQFFPLSRLNQKDKKNETH